MTTEEEKRWKAATVLLANVGLSGWVADRLQAKDDPDLEMWAGAVCLGLMRPEDFLDRVVERRAS